MVAEAQASSFFAGLRRALRPGFRPTRRDFLVPASVFLIALPFVAVLFWTGRGLYAAMALALAFFFVTPVALFVLLLSWKAKGRKQAASARVKLQVLLCALTALPLVAIGGLVSSASMKTSMRRGDEVVAALRAYRRSHWRYPTSLEALERNIGRPLPQPTITDRFYYHGGWRSFRLRFHYPILGCKEYDSRIGYWREAESIFMW